MKTLPKNPHDLTSDPVLGPIASPANAILVAFLMLQTSEDRNLWLRSVVRHAEDLADAARAMLPPCGSEFAGHTCSRPSGCSEFHEDAMTGQRWTVL